MIYNPHEYQRLVIEKIIEKPKIFTIMEMGLGKTSCTLTAINTLMYDRFEIRKVLVIAPLRVADDTWDSEIEKWDHLKHLRISKILGTPNRRLRAIYTQADVYTINRENLVWLVDYYQEQQIPWPYDMVVVDESSSFKNSESKRTKALLRAYPYYKRCVLLTGTPMPNGELDLFAQVKILDGGARLGEFMTSFKLSFFNQFKKYTYVLKDGMKEVLQQRLADITISLRSIDHLKMPERIDNMITLKMPARAQKMYKKMEEEQIVEIMKLEEDMDANAFIIANTKATMIGKLLQMCNGACYYETEEGQRQVEWVHNAKLEALEEIIEDNEGKPIMVFYSYKHDYDRICEYFKALEPRTLRNRDDIKDWNEGKIKLLVAHPASMGHGLNLQAGGNIIVWYGVPNNLEYYLQANARLYRQGQKAESVIINHLLMRGTVDEDVMRSLSRKKVSQDDLIEAVKARINQN